MSECVWLNRNSHLQKSQALIYLQWFGLVVNLDVISFYSDQALLTTLLAI